MINYQKDAADWQKKLSREINQYNKELQELIKKQSKIKNVKKLALSILQYNRLENEISDRGYILSILRQPQERLASEFFKASLFSYFVAAETVGSELVDFLVEAYHQIIKRDKFPEFEHEQSWRAHYKEYVLPGKILAHKFEQLDDLVRELNEYLVRHNPDYDHQKSQGLLYYAFNMALNSDIHVEALIEGLKNREYEYLSAAERDKLLYEIEERIAILRFEETKNQNIAMQKAVKMLEQREEDKK